MMPMILTIDPLTERSAAVRRVLEGAGFYVEVFATAEAIEFIEERLPSLLIVAVELSDGSKILLRDKMRRHPQLFSTPVLLLGNDREGPEMAIQYSNVQDCLAFPFAPGELVNAVEDKLQKRGTPGSRVSASEKADIIIDPFAMKISIRGKEIATTTLEFRLIDYLARHQGKVFSRDALLDAVWGDLSFVTPRSVDACIRRIRRKMEPESSSPQFLRTVRGTGYKLDANPTWEVAGGACHCTVCAAIRSRASGLPSGNLGRELSLIRRDAFPN